MPNKIYDLMTKEIGYKEAFSFLKKNIDYKKGAFFASLSGLGIGLINYREGLEYAFSSGAKEGLKCLAIGSMNMGICRNLATSIENKTKAYALATIIPATLGILLTFGIHAGIKGTPHPVQSTLPAVAANYPFFLALAIRERKLKERRDRESKLGEISNGK